MAAGGEYRRKSSSDLHSSANEDEGITVSRTREKLNKVQAEIDRLQYENDETLSSSRTREMLAEAEMKLARLQLLKTSTATRDELAEIEAEIALEEDSATIVSLSPSSADRDKVNESKEKLNFIKTRKSEITELFESLKCSEIVDLCFLIECTQSIQPYIDEVKNNIHHLVANCKATFRHLVLKVAFVGYRDHCDGDNRIVILNFTEEISAFETFVGRVNTRGAGNNAAKDVFGGLEEVGHLEWSAPTRIVFHVANAPCHGRTFHGDRVKDEFPNGDPRGQRAEDLLQKLEELQVKYTFAKLTGTTDKMVEVFRSLSKHPEMLQQVTLDSVEELMSVIANLVSCSIRQIESVTMAASVRAYSIDNGEIRNPRQIRRNQSRSLKEFTLCKDVPNWEEISVEDAFVFRYKLPTTMEELPTPLKEEDRKTRRIQIAAQPFAEATQRIVYYGVDCTFPTSKKVVLKEFKYLGEGLNKLDSYKKQMEIQSLSSFLAQQFNKQKPLGAKDIRFIKVIVMSLHKRSKPFYCSQEPLIEGPYVKYNSNCGFVNKDAYAASLNAFSHWTYQVTNGYLMVVDLQGVQITSRSGPPKFTLTDPALHCKDLTRFSNTNLGKLGMHRFFRTHHCNSICVAMGLEPHVRQPRTTSLTVTRGTVVM